jgi:hypothetical protein
MRQARSWQVALATSASMLATVLFVVTPATPAVAAFATVQDINPDVSTNSDADATTGGRVNHVASAPGGSTVFYAASEQGGLFKSTNGGASWSHLNGHLPQITWDVKVDPGNANIVYATSFYDGKVTTLSGIEVSTDAGATWTHPASANPPLAAPCSATARIEQEGFGIGIRPDATNNVFIGTQCGVAFSSNSGATWTFLNPTSPSFPARTWGVLVEPGGPSSQGIVNICGDFGFRSSTNAGGSWTAGTGLPAGRCALAASPDESYVLFAAASDNNLYESDDAGATWTNRGTPDPTPQGRIPFVKTNKRASNFDLWFGDVGLFRQGCTTPASPAPGGSARCPTGGWAGSFTRPAGGHDDTGDLIFDNTVSQDACPVLMSSDGGVHVRTGGCASPTWNRSNTGMHALWDWNMAAIRAGGGLRLFVGNQDDGFQSTINAQAASPTWKNPECCDVFSVATDGNRTVITECCFKPAPATQLRVGDASGQSFGAVTTPPGAEIQTPEGYPEGDGIVGFNSVSNIVNIADKQYAVLTANGLFFTSDITAGPPTWTQVASSNSPASACGVAVAISGGTPTFFLQAGACASNTGGSLWTATGTGAASWTQIDNNNGQTGGFGVFGVDPGNPNRLYASNFAPGGVRMVRSTDGGTTWQRDVTLDRMMTGNGVFRLLNATGATNFTAFGGYVQPTLTALDPSDSNLIVAGGHDSGVFLSADAGNSWGLMTDPFTPQVSGTAHLPQPRAAFFDHPSGPLAAVYVSTQGRGVWRLTPNPTTLNYNGDLSAHFNDTANLSATLIEYLTGLPVVGATVKFVLGSQNCSGVTDATGKASCSVVINQSPGQYQLTATFDGDATRMGSTTTRTFTVGLEDTKLTYTGDTAQDYHDTAHLSAVLTDPDDGTAIAGKQVDFTLGTQSCSAITDAAGVAACDIVLNQVPGPYTVQANFAGDTNFQPAFTSAPFTITKEETTTTYTGPTVIANGVNTQFSAVLKEDGTVPIAGRSITITLGSGVTTQTCTGTTDASGTATCDMIPAQPLGPGTVRADFFGDAFYLPSTDSAATIIFAFLASGAMVIGDQNATPGTSVTYFGAQWSKLNQLSGGQAPPSFKGFAANTSEPPACGVQWTTEPGASADPPANVPSYMGTLVSSSIDQNGPVISGDTVEIVVVKTDSGYDGKVGHWGTGKVVAVFCHT